MGAPALSADKITTLAKWIDAGAVLPAPARHWAFIPPVRPAVPSTSRADWVRNPIDAFLLARLDREGLKPSPEAERATLLRRASLDLTGLPPTPAELDAFLADRSANAYEKQVDRLLASPHYGERWARVWLDAARYADSNGYEKDAPRFVWFYRDWVINALNGDMPYNQFVVEQIAGDLLPNASQDQRVATGFLRNSMVNEEGGIDPEQFRMEAMYDRIDAIGKGILGVTIQCAQCHNHKYDPLTQEEYYRIFAFLNNTHESDIAVYTPAELTKRDEIIRGAAEIEGQLQRRNPDWRERMAAWEDALPTQPQWRALELTVDDISTGGERELPMKDGSMLALGYAPTKHTVKFTAKSELPRITAVRLELLMDPNLPNGGPGRSIKGAGALTEFRVEAAAPATPEKFAKIKIASATADFNQAETPLEKKFDDKSGSPSRHRPCRVRDRWTRRHRVGHRRGPGPAQSGAQGRIRFRKTRRERRRRRPQPLSEAGSWRRQFRRQREQQPGARSTLGHGCRRSRCRPASRFGACDPQNAARPPHGRRAADNLPLLAHHCPCMGRRKRCHRAIVARASGRVAPACSG